MAKSKKPDSEKNAQNTATSGTNAQVVVDEKVKTPPSVLGAVTPAVETDGNEGEVVLTDAEGRRYCRVSDCDQVSNVDGYCRFHYLLHWKKIQIRKKILADGKLERYIEELTARYTDKFIELLRKDLRTEKDFLAAVQELELDGSADSANDDEEDSKSYLDEVGGGVTAGGDSDRNDGEY